MAWSCSRRARSARLLLRPSVPVWMHPEFGAAKWSPQNSETGQLYTAIANEIRRTFRGSCMSRNRCLKCSREDHKKRVSCWGPVGGLEASRTTFVHAHSHTYTCSYTCTSTNAYTYTDTHTYNTYTHISKADGRGGPRPRALKAELARLCSSSSSADCGRC